MSATEKTTQNPTDSTKSNKDKKDRKNSEDKKNSKDNSQNSNSSAVEKSEKSEQSSSNSSSDKKKTSSSSNSSSKPNKKNDVQPTTQDKYKTDPVPSGKPKPVEPEEQETKDTNLYCTFTITYSTILDNIDALDPEKKDRKVALDGFYQRIYNEDKTYRPLLEKKRKALKEHLEYLLSS